MIVTLCRLALLLLSYFGWWEFFRSRCRVDRYFAPALTIAFQFTVLFLPGLLNLLPEAAWVLYLGGLFFLWDALRREKLSFLKNYANPGYLLFLAALAVMALVFRGQVVTWFDNFTHWTVAVKNMLAADRFPTFAQEAVTFNTYTLGSTAMIWYFCRFVGSGEDLYMLAQGFMILCLLLPLFSFGKKNGLFATVFLSLVCLFLLDYNIPLTELLVDTLLPLAGGALLVFLHREFLRDENPLPAYFAFPFLFWVMNIKTAGILFVLAGMLFLLWRMRKQQRELKPLLVMALVLLAGYILWDRHCDYVFYNTVSQHEISVDYFSARLGEKTWADVLLILQRMALAMVLRRELAVLLIALGILGVLTAVLLPRKKGDLRNLSLFLAVSFVVYAVTLMLMYVTSMSLEGALELQSADRYIRIWEILAWYLLAVYGVELMHHANRQQLVSLVLTAAMFACLLFSPGKTGHEGHAAMEQRLAWEAPIAEYGVQPGMSYLICAQTDVMWYEAFLWAYHLDSNRILQIHVTEESQMAAEKNYDYVVILDKDNPVIERWVETAYPDQTNRTVIQCFK